MRSLAKKASLFPELPFDAPDTSGLDARDGSLARAIDAAVVRRWSTLVALLQSRLERPWQRVEPPLQAALLAGSAQLLFMDRIPDHAAVDETVGWAKAVKGPKAAGFVNAVLRKVASLRVELRPASTDPFGNRRDELPLSDGRVWRLRDDVFAEHAVERIAQVGSVGRELFLHWIAAHGFEAARSLARHCIVDPPVLLTGVPASLATDERFARRLVPHAQPNWFVWTEDADGDAASAVDLPSLLDATPGLRVQDPASGDPVAAAAESGLAPKVVVDFCAGRGTKTVQLAQAFPNATIVASDPDAERSRDLATAAARHANIVVATPAKLPAWFQKADLVVLDVPCSNTAVLPRRPEASHRFTAGRLEKLVAKQREIVTGAMPLLARGGHVLYATCSLEPNENARQTDAMRKRFQFLPRGERQRFPTGMPGEPPTAYADGGFWSVMQSRAT
jgi:16S rRNA (cytosine967-C5)-methyltransferase